MKIFLSILLLGILLLSLSLEVDTYAMELQDESFNRAMVAFGLAKGLNAVISLLQGTELSLTPVGIGINLSVGEVLDPFNDMVERFSWVMLVASVSLGIQKMLLLLSAKLFLQIALALSIMVSLTLMWFKRVQNAKLLHYSLKFLLFFLLLRASAIFFVYSSELLYISTLQVQYNESTSIVQHTKSELEELQSTNQVLLNANKDESSWDRLNANIDQLKNSFNISKQLTILQESTERASLNIITLITLFIVQNVLMPLLFIWIFWLSLKLIFKLEFNEEKLKLLYN